MALADGVSRLAIDEVLAIVSPGNARSLARLDKLGFSREGEADLGAPVGAVERLRWSSLTAASRAGPA